MKEYKNLATMVYESPISSTMTTISGNYSSDLARLFPHKSGETVEFYVTIMPNNELANSDNSEICKVSCADDGSNVTWTLLRGQRDTTAKDFNENAVITLAIYAEDVASKEYVDEKIEDIKLYKFPNAIIVGEPTINAGQVSGFTATDYLQFPMILDFHNKAFVIDFCFTTGSDVTTQQNILDSNFGLALAVKDGKGLMAVSSNGTSWNIGSTAGTATIRANTTYYARLSWNGILYKTAISTDGTTYTDDMSLASNLRPYPTTMYIGGCDASVTGHTTHPFGGSINLNKAYLTVSGQIIWQGMDDAGLATRADVSLSNLDAEGEARLNAGKITPVQTLGTSETDVMSQKAVTDAIYEDYSKSRIKIGNDSAYSNCNVAIGGGAKNNSSYYGQVSIGRRAEAANSNAIAIGSSTKANKSDCVAIGDIASANNISNVAVGPLAKTTANYAIALGNGTSTNDTERTIASGNYSIALGHISHATGENSVALGKNTTASAKNSVALGTGANATKQGEINVGTGDTNGYNGTGYRKITSVYDPEDAQDVATKNYVDSHSGGVSSVDGKTGDVIVHRELTQAQYNALSADEKNNGTEYFITDSDLPKYIVDAIYPVGSIYMSVNNADPKNLFGGTWVKIEGQFLLGASSTYTAGSTGGEATHTLTEAEMPSHYHTLFYNGDGWSKTTPAWTPQLQFSSFTTSGTTDWPNGRNGGALESKGGSQAHNNMPPYLAVNIWKRTA